MSLSAAPAPVAPNRTLAAAAAVLGYAVIIGFTDNYVRLIAEDAGLWQFHFVRTAMVLALAGLLAGPLALVWRPRNLRAVAGRSALHGVALMIYFGCLAFLPVAQVAAGLFTAPIFVLLITRFVYGHKLGPARIAAAGIGFFGVVLVLSPALEGGIGGVEVPGAVMVLPVVAGAFYAMGNIATREWCMGESAVTLTLGFFVALGLAGALGLVVLALAPQPVPGGAAGFVLRGWVRPDGGFLFWTAVQAVGSVVGVGLMVRGYQMAEASRVAIFEYVILPVSALWSWVIWGDRIGPVAIAGMVLIFAAGAMIARRGR
ncbi:MAG: DMT family transporter [Gemmobacter sp.]